MRFFEVRIKLKFKTTKKGCLNVKTYLVQNFNCLMS